MVVKSFDEQVSYLNKPVIVGHTEQFIAPFLDRGSCRLHEAVFSKLIYAFVEGLPANNLLSSKSCANERGKKTFARKLDTINSSYSNNDYNEAWKCWSS